MGWKQSYHLRTHSLAFVLTTGAIAAHPAYAETQQGEAVLAPGDNTTEQRTVFTPQDFVRFAPRNAWDMVARIPGFTVREGSQGRGLGEARENVIVDGARLPSKSEGLKSQLSRIATARVERIELVDGASLGIPGLSGQVANVVTRAGGMTGQFEWRTRFRPHYAKPQWLAGEASVSGAAGNVGYTVSLSNNDGRGAAGGPMLITDGNGALIERRHKVFKSTDEDPKVTAKLKWDGPGTSIGNFSAMYRQGYSDLKDTERRSPVGAAVYDREYRERWRGKEYELNADFDFALGPGRMKLIALDRLERSRYRETSELDYSDGTADSGDRFAQRTREGERIARGEYSWKMIGGDWQLAGEAAFNRLDRVASLGARGDGGAYDLVAFPEGSGGVREARYELILSHGRPLAGNLTARLGLGGEYSRLSQTGPDGLVRRFWRPKGSLTLAWDPSKLVDISAKVERKVGQLAFGDFLATVFLDQGNANAANARLVPPQSWYAEVEAKFDLQRWGSTNVRVYGEKTQDYIELIPLPDRSGEYRGNVPGLRNLGLEWTSTIMLDPAGFRGGRLEAEVELEHSSIRDQLTGRKRSRNWHYDRSFDIYVRHDVPNSDWAWSLGAQHNHVQPYHRLREVGREWEGPVFIYGYIENKDVLGCTLRLTVFNLNNGRHFFKRTVYDGPRDTAPVLRRESADQLIGPIFNLSLKGNF